jgi:Ca2+-binding EF-hand superfamily protein
MNADELQETFDHFDGDDDGTIDREEFDGLMEALGADMTEAELEIGFDAIDTDRSGEIDFDEFSSWWDDQ